MSSLHNDLATWAARAHLRGDRTIQLAVRTAQDIAVQMVEMGQRIVDLEHQLRSVSSEGEPVVVSREFTNELGNRIKITIEGPTSCSENVLTARETAELRIALAMAEDMTNAPGYGDMQDALAIIAKAHRIAESAFAQLRRERDEAREAQERLLARVIDAECDREEAQGIFGDAVSMVVLAKTEKDLRERYEALTRLLHGFVRDWGHYPTSERLSAFYEEACAALSSTGGAS